MKALLAVGLIVSIIILMLILNGCASEDTAAAMRAQAEADKTRAAGEAYARQVQADTAAASERAAIRETQRDASHERALEILPYVILVLGIVTLAGMAVWIVAIRVTAPRSDTALLYYLEQQESRRQLQQTEMWKAIAHLSRESRGDVVLYDRSLDR